MVITRLIGEGVKGQTFAHDLTPMVFIAGRNFSGKTSRIEAIRLALMGYIPEVGKRNSDTYDLASAGKLVAAVEFDNGARASRTLWREGQSIKADGTPPLDNALLDSAYYFDLTDNERVQYAFSRVKLPDDCTAESIGVKLRNLKFDRTTAAHEAARAEYLQTVLAVLAEKGVNDGLNVLVNNDLKTTYAAANRRVKDTIGAVRTLTELKAREQECSAERLSELDRQLLLRRQELADEQTRNGARIERATAQQANKTRRQKIDASIAKEKSSVRTELEKELDALRLRVKPEETQNTIAEWAAQMETYQQQASEAMANERKAKQDLDDAKLALAELDSMPCCKYCGGKKAGWKKMLAERLTADSEKASTALADWNLKKDAAQNLHSRVLEKHRAATGAIQSNATLKNQIRMAECDLQASKAAAARVAELEKELAGIPAPEPLEPTQNVTESIRTEIVRVTALRDSAVRLQQDLKRAAEAEEAHQGAVAELEVIGAFGKELKAQQGKLIERVMGTLLETANRVTDGIMPAIAYHDGEIGRWLNGRFVYHRTFSGTEKALTYIGIATALSMLSPFKLVILDELGRLDRENKLLVAVRMAYLQKTGVVDQVVLVDTGPLTDVGTAYQLIEL